MYIVYMFTIYEAGAAQSSTFLLDWAGAGELCYFRLRLRISSAQDLVNIYTYIRVVEKKKLHKDMLR